MKGQEYFSNVVYVLLALVFAAVLITSFAAANPLFASIVGAGIITALIVGAKKVLSGSR